MKGQCAPRFHAGHVAGPVPLPPPKAVPRVFHPATPAKPVYADNAGFVRPGVVAMLIVAIVLLVLSIVAVLGELGFIR